MSKQYIYIERRIPATPRNKRLTDAIVAASSTGGGYIGGGGGTSYWQLVTTDADGNALAEEDQYLVPVGAYNVMSEMDVVAYSTGGKDIILPIASSSALGAIKVGNGLSIDSNGVLSATGAGSIAGINISPNTGNVLTGATLSADGKTITFTKDLTALTTANYTTTLDTRYVKKSGDTMTGTLVLPYGSADNTVGLYFKNSDATQGAVLRWNGTDALVLSGTGYNTAVKNSIYFRPLGTTGPDIMAVRSNNLVDVYGSLHATNDIVAYSTGSGDISLPIASASALGAIKIGSGLSIASDGTLSATGTGSVGNVVISPNTGNVITNATLSNDGRTITFAKDLTALTTTNYTTTLDTRYVKKSGDTMAGALIATKSTSNIATGTAPLSVSSTTVCANLNADMLDGKHAGVQNGQVAVYVSFPNAFALVSLGYNTEANKFNNEEYLKGICKWAIDTYAGNGDCTLIGVGSPNSNGTLILHLYSNDGKDSTTGLPRYCGGIFFHTSGAARTFGTVEYVWKWSHSTWEGNALTATKLQTPRTLWGQSFDGTGNVNGHITMDYEYCFKAYMPRKSEGGGGWVYHPFMILDAAQSDFAHMGVWGVGDTLDYIYIGSNAYNSTQNLRIYPNGKVYTGGNVETGSNVVANGDVIAYSTGTAAAGNANGGGQVTGTLYWNNYTGNACKPIYILYSGNYFMINHGGDAILSQNAALANNTNAYIKFTNTAISIAGSSSGSDLRLKKDIQDMDGVLDKLENFNAIKFKYKDETINRVHYGVIAQNIIGSFPEIVYTDSEGYYLVNYQELTTAISIQGIKELHALIKSQQAKIDELERRLSILETK